MGIESIQYFLKKQRPVKIADTFHSIGDSLNRIPTSAYVIIIIGLGAFAVWLWMRHLRIALREEIKNS